MNATLPEIANPFTTARITGVGVNPKAHHKQCVPRGDKAFIMSRSELAAFAVCPAKWRQVGRGDDDSTSAMELGDAIDCLILTPDQFDSRFAVAPSEYTPTDGKDKGKSKPWNWNATVCDDWRLEQEAAGKVTLKSTVHNAAITAARRIVRSFASLLDGSMAQIAVESIYHDKATGLDIPVRSLVDLAPAKEQPRSLYDLKSSGVEPTDRKWSSKVHDEWLDAQAALYLDLWNVTTEPDRVDFRHIIVEQAAPYHVEERLLSAEFVELGRFKYTRALKRYCQCLASDEWPGYECAQTICGIGVVQPSAWMFE